MVLECGEGGSNGSEIVGQINENTEEIVSLNSIVGNFYHETGVDILDIPITITELVTMTVPDLPTGEYLFGFSITSSLDVTNESIITTVETNGNIEVFSRQPASANDRDTHTLLYPFTQTNISDFNATISMNKDGANGTLNAFFANVWIEKKAELPTP